MAIQLDRELLADLGLGSLSNTDAQQLLREIYRSLELRVGTTLAQRMTGAQLDRFEAAVAQDPGAANRLLEEIAPDYRTLVAEQFEVLKLEVAEAAPTLLHLYVDRSADHDPWRHRRPDIGPTFVGSPDRWVLVVSPMAEVVVALDPTRAELYARRRGGLPVVLRIPDGHYVDPTTLWCNDQGEVRARFAEHSDLRWRIADRPCAATRQWDKVWWRQRAPLRWTDVRLESDKESDLDPGAVGTITQGRWRVHDGHHIVVEDRLHGGSARLEPLCDEAYWYPLEPHFTPDTSQLVATYNTERPPYESGLHACSVGYLDAMKTALPDGVDAWPWEYTVHPTAIDGIGAAVPPIDDIGYDASATRAALVDHQQIHLYDAREWTHLGSLARPEGGARFEELAVPGGGRPSVAWAGRSLIVVGDDGRRWRLDLQRGPGDLEPLRDDRDDRDDPDDGALAAAVSWGDRVALVYRHRTLVGVDARGGVLEHALPGDAHLRTAAATVDGRLLVASDHTVELFAGNRLVAATEVPGAPVVGIAPGLADAGYALAWHEDETVSTLRLAATSLAIEYGTIPHLPLHFDDIALSATAAEMTDLDQWHLITGTGVLGQSFVLGINRSFDIDATCLAALPAAGLTVFGTATGLEFLRARGRDDPVPATVRLPGPVRSVATGQCARSLAAVGNGVIWLVRLLR